MRYPDFFDAVAPLELYDGLADFLGAFEAGKLSISYLECVKMAGHSCPTVAGAFVLTKVALSALFGEEIPQRGKVRIAFREKEEVGVTGVMAAVMGNITGASSVGGFKGINGAFSRAGLLRFGQHINGMVRFERIDTGAFIALSFLPARLPQDAAFESAMKQALSGKADALKSFGEKWQNRVREVLLSHEKYGLVRTEEASFTLK